MSLKLLIKDKLLETILFLLLVIVFVGFEYTRTGDFGIYLQASREFVQGNNIYLFLYGETRVFEYMGSPFLSFVMVPFAILPLNLGPVIWKLVCIILLYRSWIIINEYLPIKNLGTKGNKKLLLLSLFSASFLIYTDLHYIQFTIFILYCILEGLYQINKGNNIAGGLIIAFAILVKLLPIVFIPYLLYRGKFKSVLYIFLFLAVLIFIPAIFIGWDFNLELYNSWWKIIDPANDRNSIDVSTRTIYGLSSLLATLLIEGVGNDYTLEIKRNLFNINQDIVFNIILAFRVLLILFTLYFLRKLPFKNVTNRLIDFWSISYLCLVIPVIFPQQRMYAFVLCIPALLYINYYLFISRKFALMNKWKFAILLSLQVLIVLALNIELFIGEFREFFWHFKIISYASLLLIVQLALCNPSHITEVSMKSR